MHRIVRLVLVLPLLAACSQEQPSGPDSPGGGDARDREIQQLRQQVATMERKMLSLEAALARPRASRAATEEPSAAPSGAGSDARAAPGDAAVAGADGAALAAAAAPGVRAYLESDDGKKAVGLAVRAVQEQADQERTMRMVEDQLARFAKDANLTDDQVTKMRDILAKSTRAARDAFSAFRDGGADLPAGERDAARQKAMARLSEIRKSAEDEAKVVLSQTQFEQYQQTFSVGPMGGFGGRGPGGRPPGRGN